MGILKKLLSKKTGQHINKPDPIAARISITKDTTTYRNLSPVSDYSKDKTFIKMDDAGLERDIESYVVKDAYPVPETSDREGYYGTRHFDYWLSGLKDYLLIKKALKRCGITFGDTGGVFDFGCSSGRVLRHFLCQEEGVDLWGADINLRHVEWVRRFLGPTVKVFQNTTLPHLPLEDNAFSLVYAFSVFTHIDEFELAWLSELHRILKKGGLAYLTIHSEDTWKNIEKAQPLYDALLAMNKSIDEYDITPEFFKKKMPSERIVFKWQAATVYNCHMFHSTEYIKDAWGRFFEVVEIINNGSGYQDVVLLRKR